MNFPRKTCLTILGLLFVTVVSTAVAQPESGIGYTDITVRTTPRPGLRVVSGNLVYEEQMLQGGLRTRSWSPQGLIKPDAFLEDSGPRQDKDEPPLDEPIACAFGLSVDGQELWDGWELQSSKEIKCPGGHCREVVEELVNRFGQLAFKVHTRIDGNPFLRRWLEITNDGTSPAAIGSVFPMSGYLFAAHGLAENLPAGTAPFSVLRPANFQPHA